MRRGGWPKPPLGAASGYDRGAGAWRAPYAPSGKRDREQCGKRPGPTVGKRPLRLWAPWALEHRLWSEGAGRDAVTPRRTGPADAFGREFPVSTENNPGLKGGDEESQRAGGGVRADPMACAQGALQKEAVNLPIDQGRGACAVGGSGTGFPRGGPYGACVAAGPTVISCGTRLEANGGPPNGDRQGKTGPEALSPQKKKTGKCGSS